MQSKWNGNLRTLTTSDATCLNGVGADSFHSSYRWKKEAPVWIRCWNRSPFTRSEVRPACTFVITIRLPARNLTHIHWISCQTPQTTAWWSPGAAAGSGATSWKWDWQHGGEGRCSWGTWSVSCSCVSASFWGLWFLDSVWALLHPSHTLIIESNTEKPY